MRKENKMDFILNGQATGDVASRLLELNGDVRSLRPFVGKDGRTYMSIMRNGKLIAVPTQNATATLRKDDWQLLDEAVVKVAKPRLKAVGDLRSAGLTYNIPKTLFRH